MKELKFKMLWAINVDGIQWFAFKYKVEAEKYAQLISGNVTIAKTKCLTDKY
jgi:hypothetical protein